MAYCPCPGAASPSGQFSLAPGVAPRLFGTEANVKRTQSCVGLPSIRHTERDGRAMRRAVFTATAVTLTLMASGIVASTGVAVLPAAAAEHASKSAFCSANESIDKAGANISSNAGFLAVLKKHTHDLTVLKENAPSGALRQLVNETVTDAEAAISSNNANELNNIPDSGNIDTYCGVNGNGAPLPAYFGKGTATAFCSTFVPVYQSTQNATSKTAVLAVITAHQAQINQLASELSSLPKSIKAKASAAVDNAQKAIASKNPAELGGGNGNGPASYVALYCGQNQ